MKKRKNIKIIITAVITMCILINVLLTCNLELNYSKKVDYNEEKHFRAEEHDDYYITASDASFFTDEVSMDIELNDIYYNEDNKTITISLSIYIDKFGKKTYIVRFDDYDEGKEDFGGYVYVDQNMNPINEEETNITDSSLYENNRASILKLTEIANDKWDLNLKFN